MNREQELGAPAMRAIQVRVGVMPKRRPLQQLGMSWSYSWQEGVRGGAWNPAGEWAGHRGGETKAVRPNDCLLERRQKVWAPERTLKRQEWDV